MNIAAIFALLLHAGVCAQTEFQRADGTALAILVCPTMAAPDAAPSDPGSSDPGSSDPDPGPSEDPAPPPAPGSNT